MADQRVTVLANGSTSDHKKKAVAEAVRRLTSDRGRVGSHTLLMPSYSVRSGVHEQPTGLSAAALGAGMRASGAIAWACSDLHLPAGAHVLGIGIESCIECVLGRWLDVAVVVVARKGIPGPGSDTIVGFATSQGMPLPERCLEMALDSGLAQHTVGSKVASVMGGSGTDPHSVLTGGWITRAGLLADAAYAALVQVPGL